MGLHQDKDEEDFDAPVLSVSLGDTGIFRVGGRSRSDPTRKFELKSGDVVVLGGEDRLAFHGIDRVLAGTSDLLPEGGRINLTLRRVTKPVSACCAGPCRDARHGEARHVAVRGGLAAAPSGKSSLAAFGGPSPAWFGVAVCFAPPLATATSAGRKQRSPIT